MSQSEWAEWDVFDWVIGAGEMINTGNDLVEVYEDAEGMWRWRRTDASNGKILSTSGEGYTDRAYCEEAAIAYNQDVGIVER